jgi:hypothetical protein
MHEDGNLPLHLRWDSAVQAIQHIHLTLFAASSAYTEPVASSMDHLHKLCILGGKRKFLSQERVLKTSNMGMLLLQ